MGCCRTDIERSDFLRLTSGSKLEEIENIFYSLFVYFFNWNAFQSKGSMKLISFGQQGCPDFPGTALHYRQISTERTLLFAKQHMGAVCEFY